VVGLQVSPRTIQIFFISPVDPVDPATFQTDHSKHPKIRLWSLAMAGRPVAPQAGLKEEKADRELFWYGTRTYLDNRRKNTMAIKKYAQVLPGSDKVYSTPRYPFEPTFFPPNVGVFVCIEDLSPQPQSGWTYNAETGEFSEPVTEPVEEEV